MRPLTVLGFDLAAGAPKTYASLLEPDGVRLLASIAAGCGDEDLRRLARGCAKVAPMVAGAPPGPIPGPH
jgi:hypothetical protein